MLKQNAIFVQRSATAELYDKEAPVYTDVEVQKLVPLIKRGRQNDEQAANGPL